MFESKKMIPSEMVFRGLERLSEWCRTQQDLNAVRQQLIASIERLGSWEDSFEQNVEAMRGGGDSQPDQKASSPSREPTCCGSSKLISNSEKNDNPTA